MSETNYLLFKDLEDVTARNCIKLVDWLLKDFKDYFICTVFTSII